MEICKTGKYVKHDHFKFDVFNSILFQNLSSLNNIISQLNEILAGHLEEKNKTVHESDICSDN